MTAALTLPQVAASLEPEKCGCPDDLLEIEMYAPMCFTFRCGLCRRTKLPSKRCPCSAPLIESGLGPGIKVLRCPEGCGETLECRL